MANELKRNAILDAAEKRFAHFGLNKTTMNDIASDLAMSKASLYYYFPDKNTLYTAVFEREVEKSFTQVLDKLDEIAHVDELFLYTLHSRMDFIQRNYNMLNLSLSSLQANDMQDIMKKGKDYQIKVLRFILNKAMHSQQIQNLDVEYMAQLIYFALEGMRLSKMNNVHSIQFPTQEEFNTILKLQEDFIKVIINGIRRDSKALTF